MHGATGDAERPLLQGQRHLAGRGRRLRRRALLLSQRPWLSPDQVKDILRRSAVDVPEAGVDAEGAGALDLTAAYNTSSRPVTAARVHAGGGSLDKARGTKKVKKNGVTLTGEQDIFGTPTDTGALAEAEVAGTAGATWAGGQWLGSPLLGRDLGRHEVVRGDLGRHEVVRGDLGRGDLGRGDLGRRVLDRGDLGRSDLGRSDLGRCVLGERPLVERELGVSAMTMTAMTMSRATGSDDDDRRGDHDEQDGQG